AWLGCYALNTPDAVTIAVTAAAMWTPAGAVWIARSMTGNGQILAHSMRPKAKGNIRWYLCAWLLPALIAMLGALLYFGIFPNTFDSSFSYLHQMLDQTPGIPDGIPISLIAIAQIVGALTYGPFINMFFAVGEEIGWRGFLFPALAERFPSQRVPNLKAHLMVGLIWGIWHTPINMMGHNYGVAYPGYPWLGIVAMCMLTFSAGVLLSWLSEKSGTIWPAALAHGSINAAAGVPMLFLATGNPGQGQLVGGLGVLSGNTHQIFGPGLSGLISGIPLLVLAMVVLTVGVLGATSPHDPTQ
ncbi:MAG: CPBP family intramembrane metalloprotease, partial [Coriobacteriia bacterium]|nr:CPBP family intramembrane metalloprotease [Coriobacteriia bacterium]